MPQLDTGIFLGLIFMYLLMVFGFYFLIFRKHLNSLEFYFKFLKIKKIFRYQRFKYFLFLDYNYFWNYKNFFLIQSYFNLVNYLLRVLVKVK